MQGIIHTERYTLFTNMGSITVHLIFTLIGVFIIREAKSSLISDVGKNSLKSLGVSTDDKIETVQTIGGETTKTVINKETTDTKSVTFDKDNKEQKDLIKEASQIIETSNSNTDGVDKIGLEEKGTKLTKEAESKSLDKNGSQGNWFGVGAFYNMLKELLVKSVSQIQNQFQNREKAFSLKTDANKVTDGQSNSLAKDGQEQQNIISVTKEDKETKVIGTTGNSEAQVSGVKEKMDIHKEDEADLVSDGQELKNIISVTKEDKETKVIGTTGNSEAQVSSVKEKMAIHKEDEFDLVSDGQELKNIISVTKEDEETKVIGTTRNSEAQVSGVKEKMDIHKEDEADLKEVTPISLKNDHQGLDASTNVEALKTSETISGSQKIVLKEESNLDIKKELK